MSDILKAKNITEGGSFTLDNGTVVPCYRLVELPAWKSWVKYLDGALSGRFERVYGHAAESDDELLEYYFFLLDDALPERVNREQTRENTRNARAQQAAEIAAQRAESKQEEAISCCAK